MDDEAIRNLGRDAGLERGSRLLGHRRRDADRNHTADLGRFRRRNIRLHIILHLRRAAALSENVGVLCRRLARWRGSERAFIG